MTSDADERLAAVYSAESFRQSGHRLIDLLADQLAASLSGRQEKTLPWIPPEESVAKWQELAQKGCSIEDICTEVLAGSVRINNPRFIGHQNCTPAPDAILAGLIADFVNNGSGVYEMGMASTAMEHYVVQTVAKHFGMDSDASGVMTSGGSLANLTAMLAARSVKSPGADWQHGTQQPLSVLVSDQAHYCIDRATRIMGWGQEGAIPVPADSNYSMNVQELAAALNEAESRGRKVIAVVGNACSTSAGAFDDLDAIGDFCQQNDLWFHVDGAHGAAFAFSDKYRDRIRGIEKADSVTIDFHKMLMTPVICSALIYRRGEESFRAFSQRADYLFSQQSEQQEHDWYNLAKRTFECTKPMLSLKVYSLLAIHGAEVLGQNVDRLMDSTKRFVELIQQRGAYEIATQPQANIVCFRPRGATNDEVESIRESIVKLGVHYIVQTKLNGKTWMRATVTNPMTGEREFVSLLDEVDQLVEALSVRTAMDSQ